MEPEPRRVQYDQIWRSRWQATHNITTITVTRIITATRPLIAMMMARSLTLDPMAGLDPWAFSPRTRSVGTHVFFRSGIAHQEDVDARDKPGQGDFVVWDKRCSIPT